LPDILQLWNFAHIAFRAGATHECLSCRRVDRIARENQL
jgi:hypothetical protein